MSTTSTTTPGSKPTGRVDGLFRTRSLGIGARGIPDQYEDGAAAKVWHKYVGDQNQRTGYYKEKLLQILRENNVVNVLDVACGTGIDSIFLLEEGFNVTSLDASDKMLKYALKVRWARRKEKQFDEWVIEEGNWLSLQEAEIEVPSEGTPDAGFDAVICMGNSFAHLPDFDGNQGNHVVAIQNFSDMLKPDGVLIIDHRNYDHIISGKKPPMKNIYYQSTSHVDVKSSVLMVDGKYHMVTLDYCMYPDGYQTIDEDKELVEPSKVEGSSIFRLSYYPHLLQKFNILLERVFGNNTEHVTLADFEPMKDVETPAYYIHVVKKKALQK